MAEEEEDEKDGEERHADAKEMGDPDMHMDGLEEEDDEEEEEEDYDNGDALEDTTAIKDVQDKAFEEVKFPQETVEEVQQAWSTFISTSGSREAAGQSLFGALFDAAPSLQPLFKTPRAIMAMRLINGFGTIVSNVGQPAALKTCTETQGFQHLDLEVTVPRVVIFRDAIIDMLEMECQLTSKAKSGWRSLLNYVGGAFIYVRINYSERLKVIASSWATANNKVQELEEEDGSGGGSKTQNDDDEDGNSEGDEGEDREEDVGAYNEDNVMKGKGKGKGKFKGKTESKTESEEGEHGRRGKSGKHTTMKVFEDIVQNISNSYRLQEACDTLSLSLAKYKGTIDLAEFKAVMLASLRSLVPADWGSQHEVAWSWLWENVERMLKSHMGKPRSHEKALERFIMRLTEDDVNYLRRELYKSFFALAPAGQDYFKQSTTRLYWIADKVVEMTIEMYRDPKTKVDELSALGLRHVGYGVLTDFFASYVTGAVQVVKTMTSETQAQDGFQWSLGLMARILVRTINEGSTVVMQAVNANSEKSLRKAVKVAPRGRRATEMLNITVGTQSISPLYWAIESGSLNTAKAMIADLLVIRADRDNYYYGAMDLFERHPDIIHRLCVDAPDLLTTLLDGLIWRSRVASNGSRRVNFYIKYLIQDMQSQFNAALEWLVDFHDPKIICHPVVELFSDLLWTNLANRSFLLGRLYFMATLIVFICAQAIIPHMNGNKESMGERIATFACRCLVYLVSMGQLCALQIRSLCQNVKDRDFVELSVGIKVPQYLFSVKEVAYLCLLLCLVIMCTQEPIWYCLGEPDMELFTQNCYDAESHKEAYATISMLAMLLYWMLMLDLTIVSMRLSAYMLVCTRLMDELGLYLGGVVFLVTTFASSISVLNQAVSQFESVASGLASLVQIAFRMFPGDYFDELHTEVALRMAVSIFIVASTIFMLNLLVAQLNAAYDYVYADMLGYARLNRGGVIVSTMATMQQKRWNAFLHFMQFDRRLEFNEGDIGVAGGIQILEPSNANPTTVDMIVRYGGTTSPSMPWPEDENLDVDDDDKMERLEKGVGRVMKKIMSIGEGGAKGKKGGSSAGGSSEGGSSIGSE
eukprot:TRINITY_DN31877_c3_g1_i2.p1 TRINITY_DN31877_c3_g1~~TRINITY_DN31877_c3_g1_i2.p1  ORF type:complete len:1095 (-),score=214.15 TRINITY_DN31877_c3_g1_i2:289-3573(-)